MAPPTASTELDAQYRVLKEGTGLVRRESSAWLSIVGPDAAEYLEGQLTNEIESLGAGAGCYAALLDRKGRMQSDLRVLRVDEDEFLIESEAEARPRVTSHLETYRVASRLAVEPLEHRDLITLAGPATAALPDLPILGEHDSEPATIGSAQVLAIGTSLGIDLLCPRAEAEAVSERLCEGEAEPVDEQALEILRVEAGIPRYGHEMDQATIPQEAGINERAVSFTKGCYIGQETVARLHYKGKPNRFLRRLALEAPVAAGDSVSTPEREVGAIGTAVVSPARGPLALAVLRREAEPGATVSVGEAGVQGRVEEIA